jgi:hypothetical protein
MNTVRTRVTTLLRKRCCGGAVRRLPQPQPH